MLLVRRPLLYLFVSDLQPTLFRSGETNTAARHVSGSKFDGLGWQGESLRMIATAEHSSAALFRFYGGLLYGYIEFTGSSAS